MYTKRYKATLFGVVAAIALFATAKAQANSTDSLVFDPVAPVTEGQSGTVTGTFTNHVVFPETVAIDLIIADETQTGDPSDTWSGFANATITCAGVCPFSLSFTTFPSNDVGEPGGIFPDFGSTTDTFGAFVGGDLFSGGTEVASASETLTVNDVGVPGPIAGSGLPGLILVVVKAQRRAEWLLINRRFWTGD